MPPPQQSHQRQQSHQQQSHSQQLEQQPDPSKVYCPWIDCESPENNKQTLVSSWWVNAAAKRQSLSTTDTTWDVGKNNNER